MFIHFEDKTEFQMKISDEGYLYIYCPNDKKLWGSAFTVIPTGQRVPESDRSAILSPNGEAGIEARPTPADIRGNRTQDKITTLAEKAFPEAFI